MTKDEMMREVGFETEHDSEGGYAWIPHSYAWSYKCSAGYEAISKLIDIAQREAIEKLRADNRMATDALWAKIYTGPDTEIARRFLWYADAIREAAAIRAAEITRKVDEQRRRINRQDAEWSFEISRRFL